MLREINFELKICDWSLASFTCGVNLLEVLFWEFFTYWAYRKTLWSRSSTIEWHFTTRARQLSLIEKCFIGNRFRVNYSVSTLFRTESRFFCHKLMQKVETSLHSHKHRKRWLIMSNKIAYTLLLYLQLSIVALTLFRQWKILFCRCCSFKVWVLLRPATRGAHGGSNPCKFFGPSVKMCWHSWKSFDIVWKFGPLSEIPHHPWCPKLVTDMVLLLWIGYEEQVKPS